MTNKQILVLQVPLPEPLRMVEAREELTKKMHAEMDYAPMWLVLFEDLVKYKKITLGASYPVMVAGRYIMAPSPIPKFDNPKLHQAECLYLFGAGREKKIYAVPPYTDVISLAFDDIPFEPEDFKGRRCRLCGSEDTYMDEMFDTETGERYFQCSDTSYCREVREA